MTKIKLKNLILSFCLMLAVMFSISTATFAYADAETIVATGAGSTANSLGVATETVTAYGSFGFDIPASEEQSEISVRIFDESDVEYSVVDCADGEYEKEYNFASGPIKTIKYNSSEYIVVAERGHIGNFTFKYLADVTRADSSTYSTDLAYAMTTFVDRGILLSTRTISVYQNSTLSESTLRSYLVEAKHDGQIVDLTNVVIDTSELQLNVIGLSYVNYTLSYGGNNYKTTLEVNVTRDLSMFEIEFLDDNVSVEGTAANPYNFGQTQPNSNVEFYISANDTSIEIIPTITFNKEGFSYNIYDQSAGVNGVRIIAPQDFQETVTGTLTIIGRDENIGTKTFVFTITYKVTTPPTIEFVTDEILTINKKTSVEEIEQLLREQVAHIVEYNGTFVDEAIEDTSKLRITYDMLDNAISGTYTATYTYTSEISGEEAIATFTFELINQGPEIDTVTMETTEAIANNAQLAPGTQVKIKISAYDIDEDAISYFVVVNTGIIIEDAVDTTLFTYTPNSKYVGTVTFTAYCVDEENQESDQVTLTVRYVDTQAPTITFTDDVVNASGAYNLHLDKNKEIWFVSYISKVEDNVDTIANNQVQITSTGFNLTSNRAIFEKTGRYSVIYTVKDSSNNETKYTVNIIINNSKPIAYDVDGGIHAYGTQVIINLASHIEDADNDSLNYYRDGVVFDQNDYAVSVMPAGKENDMAYCQANPLHIRHISLDMNTGKLTLRPGIKFVGTLKLQYHVQDLDNEVSEIKNITINFIDNVAPEVTRSNLRNNFVINKSQGYSKTGFYNVYDAIDGDNVTTTVTITNLDTNKQVDDIDFSREGRYRFDYSFKDQSPNSIPATVSIEVNVTKGSQPVITLTADSATIEKGVRFSIFDYIYSITDEEDGVITTGFESLYHDGALQMSRIPTSEEIGVYTVSMRFFDSDGNMSDTITFTLHVEKPASISPLYFIAGGAALAGAILILVIAMAVRKSKMRI